MRPLRKVTPGPGVHVPKNVWKTLRGVTKKKRILEHLAKIEQGKSSLVLYIETIDSSLLHTIHLEVLTVQTAVDGIYSELPAIRGSVSRVRTLLNAVEVLPVIAKDVERIYEKLPGIFDKVTTVYNELPAISRKVAAVHDELLPNLQEDMQQLILNQSVPTPPAVVGQAKGLRVVPYARNTRFVGRDTQLRDLEKRLRHNKNHNRVAIVGLGGVGKSRVALEYAYVRREANPRLPSKLANLPNFQHPVTSAEIRSSRLRNG